MTTQAQIDANRRNAQFNTGPASPEAKSKVSLNAVKTALTGRTVLLPGDDATAYQSLIDSYLKTFEPVGPIETGLVQSLVDTYWRLDRIPALEYALVTMGRAKMASTDPDALANNPAILVEMTIRVADEKHFRNLQIQENRLVRRREREMQELRELQATRKAQETEELNRAAQIALLAQKNKQPLDLAANGIVFSAEKLAAHMAKLTPEMKQNLLNDAVRTIEAAA